MTWTNRVDVWATKKPGDWFIRNHDNPLITIKLPCGHDGVLRQFTVERSGDSLTVKELVMCPVEPLGHCRGYIRNGEWFEPS